MNDIKQEHMSSWVQFCCLRRVLFELVRVCRSQQRDCIYLLRIWKSTLVEGWRTLCCWPAMLVGCRRPLLVVSPIGQSNVERAPATCSRSSKTGAVRWSGTCWHKGSHRGPSWQPPSLPPCSPSSSVSAPQHDPGVREVISRPISLALASSRTCALWSTRIPRAFAYNRPASPTHIRTTPFQQTEGWKYFGMSLVGD